MYCYLQKQQSTTDFLYSTIWLLQIMVPGLNSSDCKLFCLEFACSPYLQILGISPEAQNMHV